MVRRAPAYVFAAAVMASAFAAPAGAQDNILRKLNIDKLEIQSLGIVVRSHPAVAGGAGEHRRRSRAITDRSHRAGVSCSARATGSRASRTTSSSAFVDSLQKSVSDPAARVVASPIRIYDVTFSVDARYTPQYNGWIKPFGAVGMAAHVVNAEGSLIKGTFVERSLDDIAAGLYAAGGVSVQLLPHFGVEASARGDLLSGFRSTQVKIGAAYILGQRRDQTECRAGERAGSTGQEQKSMKDAVKIGVVGAGAIAQLAHLPVLTKMRGASVDGDLRQRPAKGASAGRSIRHRRRAHRTSKICSSSKSSTRSSSRRRTTFTSRTC